MSELLDILYLDDQFVAINKPSGLLVHRSMIDRRETRFALQLLRDQLGQRVFPLHRLDKPTSGALLFALSADAARAFNLALAQHPMSKSYLAVVRGYGPEQCTLDYPLKEELDKICDKKARRDKPPQAAVTHFERLAVGELPVAIDRYPTSRYSLMRCVPETGRKHQIRRHLKHLSHPIVGDAKHGKGVHNRYFRDHLGAGRLLLHAERLSFYHPQLQRYCTVTAPKDAVMAQLFERFGWTGLCVDFNEKFDEIG